MLTASKFGHVGGCEENGISWHYSHLTRYVPADRKEGGRALSPEFVMHSIATR